MKFQEKQAPKPSTPTPSKPVHVPLRKDQPMPTPQRGVPSVPSPSPNPKK